ncbi:hypothetical protein IQ277_31225 [Nostocales cyanobacterium LEGE 12452]|nr:hypothetical protein [Nostocales cyanobacterium LEGE 12452]
MPKFYLQRTGKISTAIDPFVKQTALPQSKYKPSLLQGKIIPLLLREEVNATIQ